MYGGHVCAWRAYMCMEAMRIYGGHVCVWRACTCTEAMCVYGGHVCVWRSCVCIEAMCVYGVRVRVTVHMVISDEGCAHAAWAWDMIEANPLRSSSCNRQWTMASLEASCSFSASSSACSRWFMATCTCIFSKRNVKSAKPSAEIVCITCMQRCM